MNYEEALRKAVACLKLAEHKNTSPEEASAAAAAAQKIIDKFKLDVTALDFDANQVKADAEPIKDFGYEDPLDNMKESYAVIWGLRLASVVSHSQQCRIIYRDLRDGCNKRIGRVIKIVGRASDVSACRYLYSYFKSQIVELQKRCCAGNSACYKNQFAVGCTDTLNLRLNEQRTKTFTEERAANNGLALVKLDKAIMRIEQRASEVAKFVDSNFNLRHGRAARLQGGASGRAHGQAEGRNIRMTGASGSLGSGRKALA